MQGLKRTLKEWETQGNSGLLRWDTGCKIWTRASYKEVEQNQEDLRCIRHISLANRTKGAFLLQLLRFVKELTDNQEKNKDSETVTGFPLRLWYSTTEKTAYLPSLRWFNWFLLWACSASSFSDTIWCYWMQTDNVEIRKSLFAQITIDSVLYI